jgi:hypothetical protein
MSATITPADADQRVAALVDAAGVSGADVLSIVRQLTALAGQLSGNGQPEEGVIAQEAAISLLEGVDPAIAQSADYLTLYAESLHDLAQRFDDAGAVDQAADAARRAIPAYVRAAVASGADVAGIAWNLALLSKFLISLNLPQDALAAQQASVEVLESFGPPERSSADYVTLLGEMRHNLAVRLIEAGQLEAAGAQGGVAIVTYGEAAWMFWTQISADASALVQLARSLSAAGLSALAATAEAEAVAALRDLEPPESRAGFVDPASRGVLAAQELADTRQRIATAKAGIVQILGQLDTIGGVLSDAGLSDLANDAQLTIADVQATRFCGVPDDNPAHGLGTHTAGAPGGRWTSGDLMVSISTAGCSFSQPPPPAPQTTPATVITGAVRQWQAVAPSFFSFRFDATPANPSGPVDPNANVRVTFNAIDGPGKFLGRGNYPPSGQLNFDSAEAWSPSTLLAVALHEMGHVLGLSHSNTPRCHDVPVPVEPFDDRRRVSGRASPALRLGSAAGSPRSWHQRSPCPSGAEHRRVQGPTRYLAWCGKGRGTIRASTTPICSRAAGPPRPRSTASAARVARPSSRSRYPAAFLPPPAC